ncbi:cell division control protein 45 [Echinococcus multilocularis]|uniref:Cell division control protein 45 n=1 Tax=Echinococcus multilocularis TaxID=6211 RepID=A0A068YAK3_ECHMU|nr:cell division control protein 45 [Echinococcus multilocularis]
MGLLSDLRGDFLNLLVNCGANFDILQMLEAPAQSIFFVCDSHRPIHVNNYYNQRQVHLITLNENTDDIPKFEDIYNDDLMDNSENEEEEGRDSRQRSNLQAAEKRISRRKWERRKEEILIEYESFSYRATASAVVLFDIAWKLSQDNLYLLWCAIVGHVSQIMLFKSNREHYIEQIDALHSHMNRLSHSKNQIAGESDSCNQNIDINFEEELALWMYRHWSLKDALETTIVTSTRFKLFTEGGYKRLQEFLASIGLSLRDCSQKYSTMSTQVKNNLNSLFLQFGEKFGLTRLEMFLPSFILRLSYKTPLSAMDSFWLILAALECQSNKDPVEGFHTAAEILVSWSMESLEEWMENMQGQLRSLVGQVRAVLDTDEVVAFGPFLYVYVAKSSLLSLNFRNPQFVGLLARYILTAKAAMRAKLGRNRRIAQMPLVLCLDSRYDENYIFIIGIPPLQGDDDRNLFGQAFDVAVKRTKVRGDFRHFDSNCVELHREDMLMFFEALASLLSA